MEQFDAELNDRERRARNVVIVGLNIAENPKQSVVDFFSSELGLSADVNDSIERVWATKPKEGDDRRLAIVRFKSLSVQNTVFDTSAKRPRSRATPIRVYVNADITPLQRSRFKEQRERLKSIHSKKN